MVSLSEIMIYEVNVFLGDVNCFLNQQGSCVEVILTCSVLHPVGLTPEHMAMAALSLLNTLKVTKPGMNSSVKVKQMNTQSSVYMLILVFCFLSLDGYRKSSNKDWDSIRRRASDSSRGVVDTDK